MTRDREIRDEQIRQAEALRTDVDAIRRRFLDAHGGTETTAEILISDSGIKKHYRQNPDGWRLEFQTTSDAHDPHAVFATVGSFSGFRYANVRGFQDPEPVKGLDAINRIKKTFFAQTQDNPLSPDDFDGISAVRAELDGPRPVVDPGVSDYA